MYPKQPSYSTYVQTPEQVIRSELLQTIDQNQPHICEELIKADPKRVHEIGWNNLTPLHQVCLRGNLGILQILLRNGAKLDARSSFGETPLHYACRRGDVRIIHILIKAGSDVTAIDKQSRSCMHFAASGGSVAAMHYLGTQTQLSYNAKDGVGDTALHLACFHRHFYLVNYLLRKGRTDPKQQNIKGTTALHIAAQMGNSEIVWKLLVVGDCGLLHIKDETGDTPVDVARKEMTSRHKEVVEAFRYYSSQDPHTAPAGPKFTWYSLLLLPFMWSGLVFYLSSYFNSHAGYFALIMLITLVVIVGRQSHRIHHASRWPNPVHLGAFAAGILHCIIAAYGRIIASMWPCYFTGLAVMALSVSCLYYLYYLSHGDPGILKHSKTINGRSLTIVDVALGRCKEEDFCIYTEVIKPDKTKFCRLCERVVVGLDHHCLFIMNCVAEKNHRSFVIFIFNVMTLQVFFVFESYLYVTSVYPNSVTQSYFSILFHYEPWIFNLCLLCIFAFVWECTLMYVQMGSIMKGETAYFSTHGHLTLTWKERLNNILKFFLKSNKRDKERYLSKTSLLLT
ncbi:uncharacterized protein LOC143462745 isoform X1 [Clavelina lepadiformis]|uniref:uncharacterized protein LOC143462745 isoform X1 n=1 Tax=Clavelina lepadiformis TaxID=159417 RepID=UPI004042C62F